MTGPGDPARDPNQVITDDRGDLRAAAKRAITGQQRCINWRLGRGLELAPLSREFSSTSAILGRFGGQRSAWTLADQVWPAAVLSRNVLSTNDFK